MALTITAVEKQPRTYKLNKGLIITAVDLTLGTAAGGDYSSGLDLQGIASRFGMRRILGVLSADVYSSGVLRGGWRAHYDKASGKLRFFTAATPTEVIGGTASASVIGTGDVVRAVLIGV